MVVQNGEYKIAKYGQWDGYLGSLGLGILTFLRDKFDRTKFIKGLSKVRKVTDAELQQFWVDAGAEPGANWVNMTVSQKFAEAHPELTRDMAGYTLLEAIQNGKVTYSNPDLNFAADSLFCEWAYVLDLDQGTFEVYEGFNQSPLGIKDRFAGIAMAPLKPGQQREYYQVRLLKSYSLRRLPNDTTFLRLKTLANKRDKEWKSKADIKAAAFVSA